MQTMMQPGEIASPNGEIPFLFLPRRAGIFAARSRRFHDLAEKHVLEDFLRLMGRLALGQQEVLDDYPQLEQPAADFLDQCALERLPPLGVLGWRRAPVWREGLQQLLVTLTKEPLPTKAETEIARLRRCGTDELERYAAGMLNHDFSEVPAAAVPFVGGALQVYWTAMAAELGRRNLPRLERADLCPVCGSSPVASIVRSGGAENGLRYLCCSLCASQWHQVRSVCSKCEAERGVTYYGVEGQPGPVTAESCDNCRTYLKMIKLENDAEADPQADDLATLTLDLLMEREGYDRNGGNPLFHPGQG